MEKISESITAGRLAREILDDGNIDPAIDIMGQPYADDQRGESNILEFKSGYYDTSEKVPEKRWHVVKSIVAMANSDGGCLIIGLGDDGITPTDWQPKEIINPRTKQPIPDPEAKDYFAHARSFLFNNDYIDSDSGQRVTIKREYLSRLKDEENVKFHLCTSEAHPNFHFLALSILPLKALIPCIKCNNPFLLIRSEESASTCVKNGNDFAEAYTEALGRNSAKSTYAEKLARYNEKYRSIRTTATQSMIPNLLPDRNRDFTGRETELKCLAKLIDEGRIPILHGEGGCGKTELACEFAHRNLERFPGGCFFINMHNVSSWETTINTLYSSRKIQAALATIPPNCTSKADWILDALLKGLERGDILAILDNMDSVQALTISELSKGRIADCINGCNRVCMIATTRNNDFNFVGQHEKASVVELSNLQKEDAEKLLLRKLPNDYSLSTEDKRAASDIASLLGCHAWSLEVAGSFITQNLDCSTFQSFLDGLKNGCMPEAVDSTWRGNAQTATGLLKPTFEKLKSLGASGERTMTLAKCLACFPLLGTTDIPLRFLWREAFHYPEKDESGFRNAFDVALKDLKRYALVSNNLVAGRIRMHQLTQEILRKDVDESFYNLISSTIATDSKCPPYYWTELAKDGKLMEHCPWQTLGDSEYASILMANPAYADKIIWDKLNGYNISMILSRYPELSKHLQSFEKLYLRDEDSSYTAFAKLLAQQPAFADKCDFSRLTSTDFAFILTKQPTALLDHCKPFLDTFTGSDWAVLLSVRPEFANLCNWSTVEPKNWVYLLSRQPAFLDTEAFKSQQPLGKLSVTQWAILAAKQPSIFASHPECPCKKIGQDPKAIEWILLYHPEFVEETSPYFSKFEFNLSQLSSDNWAAILKSRPQLANLCSANKGWDGFTGTQLADLLSQQPNFRNTNECGAILHRLNGYDWGRIVSVHPEVATPAEWERISREPHDDFLSPLVQVLYRHPTLRTANGVDISTLSATGKRLLISKIPNLKSELNLNDLDAHEWARLITVNPKMLPDCPFTITDPIDLAIILNAHPQLKSQLSSQSGTPFLTQELLKDPNRVRKLQNSFRFLDTARMSHDFRKLLRQYNRITWSYVVYGLAAQAAQWATKFKDCLDKFEPEVKQTYLTTNYRNTIRDGFTLLDVNAPLKELQQLPTKVLIITRHSPISRLAHSAITGLEKAAKEARLDTRVFRQNLYSDDINDLSFKLDNAKSLMVNGLKSIEDGMRERISLIILASETNYPWLSNPFASSARKYGYKTCIVNFQEDDFAHFPTAVQQSDIQEYHRYERLLRHDAKPETRLLKHKEWNAEKQTFETSPLPPPIFDYDKLITISPLLFSEAPDDLGIRLLRDALT